MVSKKTASGEEQLLPFKIVCFLNSFASGCTTSQFDRMEQHKCQKKRRANKLKNGRQKDLKNNSSKHVQQKQNSQRDKKNVGGDEAMCRGQGGQGGDLGEFGGGGRDLGAEFLGLRRHGPTLGLILI